MHSNYRSQQPGGWPDSLVYIDAEKSFRSRNWFDITWTNPALIANYQINDKTLWNTKLFATIGNRNSVGFLQAITIKDSINAATRDYNNRILNIDQYRNYGLESRIITDYALGTMNNTISGGIRLYKGSTYRRSDGKGTTGSDYEMTVIGEYPREGNFYITQCCCFC